ncbi:hypothetical protein ACFXPA_17945 [Amycolatopsis sp. NPDC059090]|uniref:hypothetical protein n=1 Tax=unclassified Amycolatopsis TaxID=2618356 RepID=UPI00366F70A8
MVLGSGDFEGFVTGVGLGPSTVSFGAGLGVEPMPLTLVDVGGGTGLGSAVKAGSAEWFGLGLTLVEPGVGFGERTESGDGFVPEAWLAVGLGAVVAFGPGDGFEVTLTFVAGFGLAWNSRSG